ncbi:MAG TPA: rhodanese-like domain-containing protein [Trueperaceae bacterium]
MNDDTSTPEVDVLEAKERIDGGALLLDVREKSEFDEARIPGSLLIPLGELAGRQEELPKDRDIMVHCRSGARSARAAQYLNVQGYRATNMAGGILAWKEAELPVEPGKEAG